MTPASLASLAYVALFPSVLAYVCWNRGVREAGAARRGDLQLMPVFCACSRWGSSASGSPATIGWAACW